MKFFWLHLSVDCNKSILVEHLPCWGMFLCQYQFSVHLYERCLICHSWGIFIVNAGCVYAVTCSSWQNNDGRPVCVPKHQHAGHFQHYQMRARRNKWLSQGGSCTTVGWPQQLLCSCCSLCCSVHALAWSLETRPHTSAAAMICRLWRKLKSPIQKTSVEFLHGFFFLHGVGEFSCCFFKYISCLGYSCLTLLLV